MTVSSASHTQFCFSVASIRSHIAAFVPISDQILLLGPPFKVPKDSSIRSEEVLNALRLGDAEDDPIDEAGTAGPPSILKATDRSAAKRLFLFSKQALSEGSPDPSPCRLEPLDLVLPTEAPGPSPLDINLSPTHPLHQALAAYERQSMLSLSQGKVLADGADLRYTACRDCVKEQAVMARALRAAVSNLFDHYHGATRTRAEFSTVFQEKTSEHSSQLQRFETTLSTLGEIALHPSLVSIARNSGRHMETLLDTVPIDREKAWAQQCRNSHDRLMALYRDLETAFSDLSLGNTDASQQDKEVENEIERWWVEVEQVAKTIRNRQGVLLENLISNHQRIVQIVVDATKRNEDEIQAALTPLREFSNSSKEIIPGMLRDDGLLRDLMLKVAETKTMTMRRVKLRLREVSKNQSNIHRVLSSVAVLRDALAQQSENMLHLEHVAELPTAYRDFLAEVLRRRAYGQAITALSSSMIERLASLRNDEVKEREKFLRGNGRHLMPSFFELFAPTLATPPPLFTPHVPGMAELDSLPNVSRSNTVPADTVMGSTGAGEPGISSASTLTTETQAEKLIDGPAPSTSKGLTSNEQEGLIVSAEDNSDTGMLVDPAVAAAADAEVKTLMYENAILRQALNRLGGKAPEKYISEAARKDRVAPVDEKEMASLRKKLADATLRAQLAEDSLQVLQKPAPYNKFSDKISHSSFEVGDVGLFMPTGRGSGGKRTYLAFHTNCPHRYLNTDNIKGTPDFVLGRIVFQEELLAGEQGTDSNPYGLHAGTKFWVLTVEILKANHS